MSLRTTIDRRQLSRCGSFWYEQTSSKGRHQAKTLAGASCVFGYDTCLDESVAGLTGRRCVTAYNVGLRFDPASVIVSGSAGTPYGSGSVTAVIPSTEVPTSPSTTEDQAWNGETDYRGLSVYAPSQGGLPVTGSAGKMFHSLRLTPGVTPIRIGDMLLHRDFLVKSNFIIFKSAPTRLFSGGYLHVDAARLDCASLFSSPLNVDRIYGSTKAVADYYRNDHSPAAWLRAGMTAAGVGLFTSESYVRYVVPLEKGYAYVTDKETVMANYPHTSLAVGDAVTVGEIAGGVVRQTSSNQSASWWFDKFPDGMSMATMCRYKSLIIPAGAVDVTLHSWEGSKAHVTIALNGEPAELDAFWSDARMMETLTDRWIADATGLTIPTGTPPGTVLGKIDALYFYMANLLNRVVVLLEVSEDFMASPEFVRLDAFLRREVPSGVVPVVVKQS